MNSKARKAFRKKPSKESVKEHALELAQLAFDVFVEKKQIDKMNLGQKNAIQNKNT